MKKLPPLFSPPKTPPVGLKVLYHTIFWLWNTTFITVVYLGVLPFIGLDLTQAIFAGEIESEFLWPWIGVLVIPLVCTFIGFTRFGRQPVELMRLFYGVEAPLFGLCLLRLFVLRELTSASALVVGSIVLCIVAFAADLLRQPNPDPEEDEPSSLGLQFKITQVLHKIPGLQSFPWLEKVATYSLNYLLVLYSGFLLLWFVGRNIALNVFWMSPEELEGVSIGFWVIPLASVLLGVITAGVEPFFKLPRFPSPTSPMVKKAGVGLKVVLHSLMLLAGLYTGILLLIYAVPVAMFLLDGLLSFLEFRWLDDLGYLTYYWWQMLWSLPIFLILFVGSASIFVAMPSAFATLYFHAGGRVLRQFATRYGKVSAIAVSLTTVTSFLLLLAFLNQQPQTVAFDLLEKQPNNNQDRQELIAQSEKIRKGLVNAYLSSYRYLGNKNRTGVVAAIYQNYFDVGYNEPCMICENAQYLHDNLLSPFLYQGTHEDEQKAKELYAEFFDTPLQKGERKAVLKSLKSTAILDDAKAGVLNINQEKVLLEKQEVNVTEQGDFAEVEIHEVYKNQTFDVEEIFYSFTLPESAVITGVWLGDTPDLSQRFVFQVSPRGAAQQVYNDQVRRINPVDPALLEQVGPRHYRLRAFPVPAKISSWEGNPNRPTEMNLWLTYKVMQKDGAWPLPQLGEKRNIFWNNKTVRFRNGRKVQNIETWLEESLGANSQKSKPHQVNLEGYNVSAKPLTVNDYKLPQNQRIAVILDTSRSMSEAKSALQNALTWFNENGFTDGRLANNEADLYVSVAEGMLPQRLAQFNDFNPQKWAFYGTLQLKELLQQFAQLKGETVYDAVLVLTDQGSYELSKAEGDVPAVNAPLWVVHLNGQFPPAYEDNTLKAIQDSQGGVATSVDEVLQRMATTASLGEDVVSVVDGYAWTVTPTAEESVTEKTDFSPVAARMLVRGLSDEVAGDNVVQLDGIHAIAKQQEIVTPYSSMIVLVNDEQRQALKEAEASADRFDREVEDGEENLNQPNSPVEATSIPEPGVVIALGAFALFLLTQRKRQRV